MYQSARRAALRTGRAVRPPSLRAAPRRFASTAPTARKGTWRGTMVRWGLAIGAVYWYNTSPIFADEFEPSARPTPRDMASEDDAATVDAVLETKRREIAVSRPSTTAASQAAKSNDADASEAGKKVDTEKLEGQLYTAQDTSTDGTPVAGSPEEVEEEDGQQGAFNPETGEINWDCPCLGGMAHGPCGEQFKAAFSCFVFSEVEPKGMDCIDKFQHMQDCFRKHPEVYGAELQDDEEGAEQEDSPEGAMAKTADQTTASSASDGAFASSTEEKAENNTSGSEKKAPANHDEKQKSRSSYGEVPTKAYDATTASKDAKKDEKS